MALALTPLLLLLLLQTSPLAGTIHVIVAITTVNPESVANTFSNGVMLANLLLPTAGVRVTPATTKVAASCIA